MNDAQKAQLTNANAFQTIQEMKGGNLFLLGWQWTVLIGAKIQLIGTIKIFLDQNLN